MSVLSQRRRALITGSRNVIDSGSCGANAFWRFYSDGTLEIYGTGTMESAPWRTYDYKEQIVRLNISEGITSIRDSAFLDSYNLVYVTLPDSITTINDNAFRECNSLILDHLPDSLTYLGYSAFYNCNTISLTRMPAGLAHIGQNQFRECFGLQKIYFYSTPVIGKNAFIRCDNLTDIYVPWAEGEVAGAPWGADISTSGAKHINIHYNTVYDENGEPVTEE